jgi:hypothetical protein
VKNRIAIGYCSGRSEERQVGFLGAQMHGMGSLELRLRRTAEGGCPDMSCRRQAVVPRYFTVTVSNWAPLTT